jgi:PKD domain/Subtilase family/FlgD Ig-like domain
MRYAAASSALQAALRHACGQPVQLARYSPKAVHLMRAIVALALMLAYRGAFASEPGPPIPRRPLEANVLSVVPGFEHQLVVKFDDGVKARAAADGSLTSLAGRDIAGARALGAKYRATFRPLIELPASTLARLESRAAARSGVQQPDLGGLIVVRIEPAGPQALAAVAREFQRLPEVEFAFLQPLGVPPPLDIPPPTPDLASLQTYRGPDPGMGIEYAWGLGGRGANVRLSDCEYGWNADHEDLNDIDLHLESGQVIAQQVFNLGWDQHGTAVLGELSAPENGYGCNGMVPEAEVHTYPEWTQDGFRRVTAITNALASSSPGDVVLLEMQAFGMKGEGSFVPAEFDPGVWLAVKTGTSAGVIVVGAAGNGDQDLDHPLYQEYMNRGDSGAIIVGAGSPDINHDRMFFSTYGSRVNVQGWGASVFTTGYGWYAEYGGDRNQRYTAQFGGTSSASPFAAAAGVALQSIARIRGANLSPIGMRDLLIDTGIPQGEGGHIGPFVSMPGAVDALTERLPQCNAGGPYSAAVGQPIRFDGSPSNDPDGQIVTYRWDFGDGSSGTGSAPAHAYSTPGTFQVSLCVSDDQGNDRCCQTAAGVGLGTGIDGDASGAPSASLLYDSTPNPFNPATTIRYDLADRTTVSLKVYQAASGRVVRRLETLAVRDPGRYEVIWDGRDDNGHQVASGLFICRLEAGHYRGERKIVLLK